MKAQIEFFDEPGLLSNYPSYKVHPFTIGHCHVARCDAGLFVVDEQTDSLFLLTSSEVFRSHNRKASVVSIKAASDFIIEIPVELRKRRVPYLVFVSDEQVVRVFMWKFRYAGKEIFETSYVQISHEGISKPVEIGEIDIDFIAVNQDGELELVDTLGKSKGIRLTVANDGSDVDRDEIDVETVMQQGEEYPNPLSKYMVDGKPDPVARGYFTYDSFDFVKFYYGTNATAGYTWIMDIDSLYGIRNTVLQQLNAFARVAYLPFGAHYDSTSSAIIVDAPIVNRSDSLGVRLIDFSGSTVAEYTDVASSMTRIAFPTRYLSKGLYSVIVTTGSQRGVRTVRVQ